MASSLRQAWRGLGLVLGRGARRLAWPLGEPPRVTAWPQYLLWWWAGLAGMALAGQVATGLALLFYHPGPDPALAQAGLAATEAASALAWVLRRLHAAGASLLLVGLLAHGLDRAGAMGAGPGRRWSWLSGLSLLLAALASAQSGALLPATRGGWSGLAGLSRALDLPAPGLAGLGAAWSLHLALPWLLVLLTALHLRLARPPDDDVIPRETDPDRARLDAAIVVTGWLLAWLALGCLASAWFLDQPLPAPPTGIEPGRPAWYLLAPVLLARWLPGGWPWLPLLAAGGLALLLRRADSGPAGRRWDWGRWLALGLWLALTLAGLGVAW